MCSIHFGGWKLDRKVGYICLISYAVFLVFAIMIEFNVFGYVNPPMCIELKIFHKRKLENRSTAITNDNSGPEVIPVTKFRSGGFIELFGSAVGPLLVGVSYRPIPTTKCLQQIIMG